MDKFTLPFEEPIREIERQIETRRADPTAKGPEFEKEIRHLEAQRLALIEEIFSKLSAWDRVRIARHPSRPTSVEYVSLVFEEFMDIHGDRRFGDDKAVIAGFARIGGQRVVFIGQQKGRTTKEKLACNFGMPHPEGYRKALRAMKLAEKFGLPVLTFIDTMGAYPGIGSEERGVAEAIAVNLMEMSRLRAPLLSVVIGEGGSGGALGLGTGDRLIILEYAYYSVISPEGLRRDPLALRRRGAESRRSLEAHREGPRRSRHHGRDHPGAARRRAERSRRHGGNVEEGDQPEPGGTPSRSDGPAARTALREIPADGIFPRGTRRGQSRPAGRGARRGGRKAQSAPR